MSRSILVNEMTSSSEDDEQVSGSGSGSESESDMTTPPPPPPQPSSKITQSFSSEEAESESDMKTPPSPQPASEKPQSSSEEESESELDMKTPLSPQPASKKTQSSSEEESESESDMTTPPPPQKTQYSSSEEESESESESEADLPPKKSVRVNPNTILLSPKPITSQKPRTENPDQSISHSPLPVNRERKRKAMEVENEATESKIAKTADVEKKPPILFQRVWSEGDEITLMEGMIRYVEATNKDPTENVKDFHQFVKNSLRIDVNIKQMRDKIRRLKEKFKKNVCVPHKKKMFELSDKLWGENSIRNVEEEADDQKLKGNNCKPVVSGEAILNGVGVVHSGGGGIKIPITDEDIMNRGLELVSGAQKVEVEKKWRDLKVNELEHYLKKLEVLKEQGEVVLNAIKKSGASC